MFLLNLILLKGYGDSTGSPTEIDCTNDLLVLYNFLKSYQNKTRIYLWGQSLGAGFVSHAAKILSEFNGMLF